MPGRSSTILDVRQPSDDSDTRCDGRPGFQIETSVPLHAANGVVATTHAVPQMYEWYSSTWAATSPLAAQARYAPMRRALDVHAELGAHPSRGWNQRWPGPVCR
jgi:hypothetical protein